MKTRKFRAVDMLCALFATVLSCGCGPSGEPVNMPNREAASAALATSEDTEKDAESVEYEETVVEPDDTRWAVIASPELQATGVSDLLTAELSLFEHIELVEREQLEAILQEQEFISLWASRSSARRIELGRLLNAQRLLILEEGPADEGPLVRVLVVDTKTGSRLLTHELALETDSPDEAAALVAKSVEETQRAFPQGVQTAVAIPFFVSKSLNPYFDKHDWTSLLTGAITQMPGVAVVSLEELNYIRDELKLSGENVDRLVPLIVDGEFSARPAGASSSIVVDMTVTIGDGEEVRERIERKEMSPGQAAEFLMGEVTKRILLLTNSESTPLTPQQQEIALAQRADRLKEFYAGEQAAKLRQAILLLNPDNVDQRISLILDLQRSRSPSAREIAYPHVKYLIYGSRVTIPQGMQLLGTLHSLTLQPYEYAEVQGRMVKRSRPRLNASLLDPHNCILTCVRYLGSLPPAKTRNEAILAPYEREEEDTPFESHQILSQYASAALFISENAAGTNNAEVRHAILLNLPLAIKRMPPGVGYWLARRPPYHQSSDDLIHLCRQVREFERDDFTFFADFTELKHRDFKVRPLGSEDREKLERLRAAIQDDSEAIGETLGPTEMRNLLREMDSLRDRFGQAEASTADGAQSEPSRPSFVNPIAGPPLPPLLQTIAMEPITDWEYPETIAETSPSILWPRIPSLAPFTDNADIVWDDNSVYVVTKDAENTPKFRRIYQGEYDEGSFSAWISRARTDGENIWITTAFGIDLVSPEGEILAHFDEESGLPVFANLPRSSIARGWLNLHMDACQKHIRAAGYNGREAGTLVRGWMDDVLTSFPHSNISWLDHFEDRFLFFHDEKRRQSCLSAFPLAPGKCLASGRFGEPSRNWLALLTWDKETRRTEVQTLHHAVRQLNASAYEDAEFLAQPEMKDLAFGVPWICPIENPNDPLDQVVLIGRVHKVERHVGARNVPLALDLRTLEVTVATERFQGLEQLCGAHAVQSAAGSLVVNDRGMLDVYVRCDDDTFQRIPVTDKPSQNVFLIRKDDKIYSPGLVWYRVDLSQGIRVESIAMATAPPQHRMLRYAPSAIWGIWAMTGKEIPMAIDPENNTPREISIFSQYVPMDKLEAHDRAAEVIRKLGGYIDRGEHGARNGGTTVCLTSEWQGGDEGLKHIADLGDPCNLHLIGVPITDEGMKRLQGVKLGGLHLSHTRVTNQGLAYVDSSEMRELSLEDTGDGRTFGDDSLGVFETLAELSKLRLYGPGFTPWARTHLVTCRDMRKLVLTETLITEEAASELAPDSFNRRLSGEFLSEEEIAAILARRESATTLADGSAESPQRPIVYLGPRQPYPYKQEDRTGSHGRYDRYPPQFIELIRQAVLMAARDELGAVTRDHWLGETLPPDDGAWHFELRVDVLPKANLLITLTEMQDGKEVASSDVTVTTKSHYFLDNTFNFGKAAEELFPEQLKRLGVPGRANPWSADAPVPEDIKQLLDTPNFASQLLAVQRLHRIMREEGASTQRVVAIVRGYVNLSCLTKSYFYPMHDVFKARALLYAERLKWSPYREPGQTLGHGAYAAALSLIGFHERASEEYKKISSQIVASPDWINLGNPVLEYDFAKLKELSTHEELQAWGPLFALGAQVYGSAGDPAVYGEELARLRKQFPQCHALTLVNSYGAHIGRLDTQYTPTRLLGMQLYPRLAGMDELPDDLRETVNEGLQLVENADPKVGSSDEEFAIRARLVSELQDPSIPDSEELSWQVLGAMIRELTFAQTTWRLFKMRAMGQEETCRQWLETTDPMTRDHRFRPLLDCFGDSVGATAKLPKEEEEVDRFVYRLGGNGTVLLEALDRETAADFERWWIQRKGFSGIHGRYSGMLSDGRWLSGDTRAGYAGLVFRESAKNPVVIQSKIMKDWDTVYSQVDAWWDKYADHEGIRRAIALKHYEVGEYELAAERLESVKQQRPDPNVCQQLARTYRQLGRYEEMNKTLDQYFELDVVNEYAKASMLYFTALEFLHDGQHDLALEFLDRAAGVNAEWGLRAKAVAAELRGDFKTAHDSLQQYSAFSTECAIEWYWLCLRTGMDPKPAQRRIDPVYEARKEQHADSPYKFRPVQNAPAELVLYLIVSGNEEPSAIFLAIMGNMENLFFGHQALMLALEHDSIDQETYFDRLLPRISTGTIKAAKRPYFYRLSQCLVEDLRDAAGCQITDEQIEEILEGAPEGERVNICYFVGKYLSLHDQQDRAVTYWRRAAQSPLLHKNSRTLAVVELRKRGMTTEEYRELTVRISLTE